VKTTQLPFRLLGPPERQGRVTPVVVVRLRHDAVRHDVLERLVLHAGDAVARVRFEAVRVVQIGPSTACAFACDETSRQL
jgi:hypothetical protein